MKYLITVKNLNTITAILAFYFGLILFSALPNTSNAQTQKKSFDDQKLCDGSFYVYQDSNNACNHFTPSGWMGDTKSISFDSNYKSNPYDGTSCIKISFTVNGENWAGVYWQEPENNWGDTKNAGYDLTGAINITFWAKGEIGSETVEFFTGGMGRNADTGEKEKSYPDSFKKTSIGYQELTNFWKEYTIPLTSLDLNYVIGGFGWVTNSTKNPNGATFFLDNIKYNKSQATTPTPLASPTLIPTLPPITPTPTPTVTVTPTEVCEPEAISVSPTSLTLKRNKSGDVTVTVTGADDCAVEGETVTVTINSAGKKRISVSPTSAATDASGQATFTITAKKKTGSARVTFKAGDVEKSITVKVRK